MSERQYNVGEYVRDWETGKQTLTLCYKTWVTLAKARQRLGHNGGRGHILVYRDIGDWEV